MQGIVKRTSGPEFPLDGTSLFPDWCRVLAQLLKFLPFFRVNGYLLINLRIKFPHCSLGRVLCLIHGKIRILLHRHKVFAVFRIPGDTAGNTQMKFPAARKHHGTLIHRLLQFSDLLLDLFLTVISIEQHIEFITGNPGANAFRWCIPRKALTCFPDILISPVMTEGIVGMLQIIQINHALLGLPDAELSDITDVYSHPQALMQCGRYLESHREWEKHSLKNTAMAAKKVKEDGKKHKAAIASSLTADIYGLKVLDECIQDNRMNATRFIIVSGKRVFTSKAEKISICFEGMHESGSLYHMLSHFIYNGINMNHIESRPVQGKNWEYRFFVDFEGNLNDAAVQNALRGLTEETLGLKILGNY